MSEHYDDDKLYSDVKEMIGSHTAKVAPVEDEHFNDDTYKMGMSAKRDGHTLIWNNGKSISLGDDYSDAEIKFLQNTGYDIAMLIL